MLMVVPTMVHISPNMMIYLSLRRGGGHDVGGGSPYIRRNGAYIHQYPPGKKGNIYWNSMSILYNNRN